MPGPGEPGEPEVEDKTDGSEVWETLKALFPNKHEQRVAYLLFHCGLKPREIVQFCSPEWSSVHEIYSLRCNIVERVLRHADLLRWRLS